MAYSCEVAAFQCCFSLLQEGIQHELSEIVPKFFAKSLISPGNQEKALLKTDTPGVRAAHLLTVLQSKIKGDTASFNLIIQELDSCPTLQHLATKLRSELERIKGEKERQQGPPTEVSTEETHGSSPSLSTASACISTSLIVEQQNASLEDRVTHHEMREGSQWNQQGLSTEVSTTEMDGATAQYIEQQITSLEDKFTNLEMQLIRMLNIRVKQSADFVEDVRAAALALPLSLKRQLLKSHRKEVAQASTVSEIMDILSSYWDYLNVSLFEHMAKKLGGDELKAELKVYLEHLQDFRLKTKLGDFIDALGGDRSTLPPEFVNIQMTMGNSWEDCTLEDIEQLRLRLCKKAMITSYGLYFTGGRRSSIILMWGVAEMAVSSLLSVLDNAEQRECGILAIDCNATIAVLDTLPTTEHADLTKEEAVTLARTNLQGMEAPTTSLIRSKHTEYQLAEHTAKTDFAEEKAVTLSTGPGTNLQEMEAPTASLVKSKHTEYQSAGSMPAQGHTSTSSSSTLSSDYGSRESSHSERVSIDDHHLSSPSRGATSNDADTHSTDSQPMTSGRESSPSDEVNQHSMQIVSTSFRSSVDEPGKEVVWKIEMASIRKVISKKLDKTFSKELSLKDGTNKGNRPVKLKFKLHSNGIGHDCNNSITLQVQVIVDRKYQHLFELTRLNMKVTIVIGKDEQPEFIAVREVTQQELKDFTMHDFLPHEVLDSMQAKHMELMMDAHLTYDIKPVTFMDFKEDEGITAIQ